jgi:hypothetical protein
MKLKASTLVLLLLVSAITGPLLSTASGNEAPLAEAGLDQEVDRGTTVLLDATESRDPDGYIEEYEWSIRTPDDDTITPDCPDCARTQFVASQVGTYEVTVTVTDDGGATSSDTLYVVVSPGTGPQIALSGPSNPTAGSSVTYSAVIEAGAADLDRVRWFVDGELVATRAVSGQSQTDTLARTFPSEADHTVTAEVYDEDDQHASDSISVRVEARDSGREPSTLASRGTPTIHGPRTVLGVRPLRGSYTLSLDLDPGSVANVEWRTMDGVVGSGDAETVTWSPGDHQLFAIVTYVDGSSNVARFPDGSTTVVADPKPSVSVGDLSRHGQISGLATASDGYGNLKSLTVLVDGERAARTEVDELERRKHGGTDGLSTAFSYEQITPEEPHTVSVVATDMRGQSVERTRTVTPAGEPEIVRSEFVNDPVDSYHERINASRYAAHHVLEIDLNGVDPNDIVVKQAGGTNGLFKLNTSRYHTIRDYRINNNVLIVNSYWAGTSPGDYQVNALVQSSSGLSNGWSITVESPLTIEPSKPELRYEVSDTGRVDYAPNWGLIVDAGDSFDPDGSDINYIWKHGANPISSDNSSAKFDSFQRAGLTIKDAYGLTTSNDEEFLGYFNPGILKAREVSEGPYKPNDTVRFRVFTQAYKLSKNRYDVNLGLESPRNYGQLDDWEEVHIDNGDCKKGTCSYQIPVPDRLDINNRRYRYHTGIVEIEASAFANGTYDPKVVLYNDEHPRRTSQEFTLPEANVLVEGEQYWQNVTVTDIEYTVEKPVYDRTVIQNESVKDELLANGYSIASTGDTQSYIVEKRVKTQDAQYETKGKSFQRKGLMETFLVENPGWHEAGTDTTTKTYTTTETEWRDSRTGNGTFTGETREVLITPAQYKLERKYRHEYQVQKTGTKTVTRTKYRWVQKTGTKTVTKCNDYVGCYETTETYTYWTKEPYTYTTTKTYTYYVTETDTYWATGRRHPDHEFTGESRQIKTRDAEYETQYEYQYDVEYTETVYRYFVERQVKVQPVEYEWQEYDVTTDKTAAQTMANRGVDWRIGDTRTSPVWTLKKYNGTGSEIVESFVDASNVVETRANVTGNVKQKYIDTDNGDEIVENLGEEGARFIQDAALTKREIINKLTKSDGGQDDEIDWCKLKAHC